MPSDLSPQSQKKVQQALNKATRKFLSLARKVISSNNTQNSLVNSKPPSRPRRNALGGRKTGKRKSKKNRKNKTFMKM